MVLKKTNSSLNSGATQHVSRGGFIDPSSRRNIGSFGGFIEIGFQFSPAKISKEVYTCLDRINGYLRFSMPNFPSIWNRAVFGKPGNFWNRTSFVSICKGNNWRLRDRVDEMMSDIDFLLAVSRSIDISCVEISGNSVSNNYRSPSKTVTSAQVLESPEIMQLERQKFDSVEYGARGRKRLTSHGRGVQRWYYWEPESGLDSGEDQREVKNVSERKPMLNITFHKPLLVDARASKLCEGSKRRYNERTRRREYFRKRKKQFYLVDMMEDIEDVRLGIQVTPQSKDLIISKGDVDKNTCNSNLAWRFSLAEFMATKNTVRRKYKDLYHEREAKIDACDKPRYPKGSYIYVNCESDPLLHSRACRVVENPQELPLSPNELKTANLVNSQSTVGGAQLKDSKEFFIKSLTELERSRVQRLMQKQENYSRLFTESFVCVRFRAPVTESSDENINGLQLGSIPNITTGDSLPSCFCVSLLGGLNKSYIVARKASVGGHSWFISLQGTTETQGESFRNKLSELGKSGGHVSLEQVINIGNETVKDCSAHQQVVNIGNETEKSRSADYQEVIARKHREKPSLVKDSRFNIWVKLARRQNVIIQTPHEAVDNLRLLSTQSKEPKININIKQPIGEVYQDIECGVCFSRCNVYGNGDEFAMVLMSCGHAHCVSCWRAYVDHNIFSGSPTMACMTTGCDTLVDETTLKTLVPSTVISVWQSRLKDRLLESSSYTSWCPGGRCGQVAVSSKAPLKTQFGSPLICTCSRLWCSNCQEDPHWPVSCEQMNVYKKLLSKSGGVSKMDVNYTIDVKKCPNCTYPIEKFQGCNHMVCQMCRSEFCWNCLKNTAEHNEARCKTPACQSLITFELKNKLVYDLPIEYFMKSVRVNQERALVCQNHSWLQKVRKFFERKLSVRNQLPIRKFGRMDANLATELINDMLFFLEGALAQFELFYVLIGFVNINKSNQTKHLINTVEKKITKLRFIIDRLSTHVNGRSLYQICAISEHIRFLLRAGAATLDKMFTLAPKLQKLSKDVQTGWVGNIDPSKHIHYM